MAAVADVAFYSNNTLAVLALDNTLKFENNFRIDSRNNFFFLFMQSVKFCFQVFNFL